MVEISPSRSLPLDVVDGIKQQLHSTTTTIALLRRCHCSCWCQRVMSPPRNLIRRGAEAWWFPLSRPSSPPAPTPPTPPSIILPPLLRQSPPSNQGISSSALLQCCAAPPPWRRPPPWRMTRCCRFGAPLPPVARSLPMPCWCWSFCPIACIVMLHPCHGATPPPVDGMLLSSWHSSPPTAWTPPLPPLHDCNNGMGTAVWWWRTLPGIVFSPQEGSWGGGGAIIGDVF